MLKDALIGLSSDRLREEVSQMQTQMSASLLNLGAKKAFVSLCTRLRSLLDEAQRHSSEIRDMLGASFAKLNSEFGFSLAMTRVPDMGRFVDELGMTVLLVEQYYEFARQPADNYWVMSRGEIVAHGTGADMENHGVREMIAV